MTKAQAKPKCVLTLEKRRGHIRTPFRREIILTDQVTEAVNNIRRAFRFAEEVLSRNMNLNVKVFLLSTKRQSRKLFGRFSKYSIKIKINIEGDLESAAEFLKQWARIWIWWYKGYEKVDPVEHFIETAKECGTPDDWWKVKGYIESVEELTRESLKSDAYDLLQMLRKKDSPIEELKSGMPCPLTKKICPTVIRPDTSLFFVAMPIRPEYDDVLKKIDSVLEKNGLKAWVAQREVRAGHILCKICEKIQTCENGIFEITEVRPNVMLELGLAYGLGKSIVLITKSASKVPSDLRGLEVIEYRNLGELEKKLGQYISMSVVPKRIKHSSGA